MCLPLFLVFRSRGLSYGLLVRAFGVLRSVRGVVVCSVVLFGEWLHDFQQVNGLLKVFWELNELE